MSVVGFDVGYQSCYVAIARQGGIETVANEYSERCTPSFVTFEEKQRAMGTSASSKMLSNIKNTVWGFTRLLGRNYKDPQVEIEKQFHPYEIIEKEDGKLAIKVSYLSEEVDFSSEQVTAMLLTKLKEIAEANLKAKVVDCVISVPCFFTDIERRAMLDASKIAGLNCLRIMNATTATALAYGIYKTDLPEEKDKPRNVVFVDFGHSSLQIAAVAFNKGKLKVLAISYDPNLGGRNFDRMLTEHFSEEFLKKYKVNARSRPKAYFRLMQECEKKLKKLMSSNTTEIPLNIECFMEDKDVSGRMKREDFEKMGADLFQRIEICMKGILANSGLQPDEIDSVEIVGGSSRIPAFKQLVLDVFGKSPSTTLNADEAVARGCALQCAILSPTFRVRDFHIADCQPFSVKLRWSPCEENEDAEMEAFARFSAYPQSKMLTFYKKEPFELEAFYNDELPHPNKFIGKFKIDKVYPNPEGGNSKVKFKIKLLGHGTFDIMSASLLEKFEVEEKEEEKKPEEKKESKKDEPMDVENSASTENKEEKAPEEQQQQPQQTPDAEPMQAETTAEPEAEKKPKMKTKIKNIDLPILSNVSSLTENDVNKLMEKEFQMIANDKLEQERGAAKNSVEEYVYDLRNKLCTEYEDFVKSDDMDNINSMLSKTEDWLYEEGEDEKKQVYVDKLAELKKFGAPIAERYTEYSLRPEIVKQFGGSIQQVRKAYEQWEKKDEKYEHISEEDMKKVLKAIEEKQSWLDQQIGLCNNTPKFENPPVTCAKFRAEKQTFETSISPILNKPKPKVEPPAEQKDEKKAEGEEKKEEVKKESEEKSTESSTMDVD